MDTSPQPRQVAIVGPDPVSRSALRQSLADEDLDIVAELSSREVDLVEQLPGVDALIWDDGVDGTSPGPSAGDLDVIALVGTADRAEAHVVAGANAVLLRDGNGARVAAAVYAAAAGLTVIDNVFAKALVGPAALPEAPEMPSWLDPLTTREEEVLELMAEGFSNREIASELAISPHTAKFHVNAILGKLDAQTRTEAVVRAARLGVLAL